nr:hypothetical protein OG409_01105 [Streptomyces sp. NBC_00974]
MRRRIAAILLASLALAGCSGEAPPKPDANPTARPSATGSAGALALGTRVETVGAGGLGRLELTPTSIAYLQAGSTSEKPQAEGFVFVTVKVVATAPVGTAQTSPVSNGGWSWVAPDGEAIKQGNGSAFNVVAESFNASFISPGTFDWAGVVFDVKVTQAGGMLLYTDGAGQAYRWAMPKTDSGPQVAQIKQELAP